MILKGKKEGNYIYILKGSGRKMANKLAKFLGVGAVLFVAFTVGKADAAVTGACVNCHTMHNSQDAAAMRTSDAADVGAVGSECLDCHGNLRANLLQMSCLGCHAQNLSGPNIQPLGNVPQVYHGGADLAAGNFAHHDPLSGPWGTSYGHQIHGIDSSANGVLVGEDFWLNNTPPGYFANMDPSAVGFDPNYPGTGAKQMFCAGANGCHGNRSVLSVSGAMAGAHHDDDSALKFGSIDDTDGGPMGDTVGTSYRFLYNVRGGEDDDWQATSGPADHNEYMGAAYAARSTQAYGDGSIKTMSNFCGECHGDFHAAGAGSAGDGTDGIGTGASPWIRHPNDIALPAGAPWDGYTTYGLDAPVGRTAIPNAADSNVAAGDIVMCLSCHKAHASQYADMLRFSYQLMQTGTTGAGQGTGCFRCHTLKDG